jgi:hypothetical protein
MDNPDKTKGAIKNGQSRENQRGNQEWTIQIKAKGQSRMDNPEKTKGAIKNGHPEKTKGAIKNGHPEKTKGAIKNGQSRETGKNWAQKIQDEDKHKTK